MILFINVDCNKSKLNQKLGFKPYKVLVHPLPSCPSNSRACGYVLDPYKTDIRQPTHWRDGDFCPSVLILIGFEIATLQTGPNALNRRLGGHSNCPTICCTSGTSFSALGYSDFYTVQYYASLLGERDGPAIGVRDWMTPLPGSNDQVFNLMVTQHTPRWRMSRYSRRKTKSSKILPYSPWGTLIKIVSYTTSCLLHWNMIVRLLLLQ